MDSDEPLVLLRIRSRNWYSFAPLVASLKSSGINDFLMIKNVNDDILSKIKEYLARRSVFFLDSYKTMEKNDVEEEIEIINSCLHSGSTEGHFYTIVGGPHPTGDPESSLKAGFDYVIRGEGEKVLVQLINHLRTNEDEKNILSLSYIDPERGIIHNSLGEPLILDNYCPYVNIQSVKLHPPIEIARGCFFHCKFCQVPTLYSKVRYRSLTAIDKIFKHYAEVFKNQNSLDIRFITPNFLSYGSNSATKPDMDKLWKLVDLGKKYNARLFMGTFPSEIRPEIVDEDTIQVLKESSSRNIAIGCQSGSLNLLKSMRRGHGIVEVEHACEILTKNGFIPHVDFILGSPGEKETDMHQSLEMMRKLISKGCKIRVHHFLPLPGTAWENKKPSIVPKEISVEIGKLTKNSAATGCFERQKTTARNQ